MGDGQWRGELQTPTSLISSLRAVSNPCLLMSLCPLSHIKLVDPQPYAVGLTMGPPTSKGVAGLVLAQGACCGAVEEQQGPR